MEISIHLPLNSNNKRKKKRGRKEEVKVRSDRRGKEITCPGSSLDPGDRAAPAQLNFPHPEVTFFFFVQMNEHVQSALLDLCGHGLRGFGGLLVFLVPWSCLLPSLGCSVLWIRTGKSAPEKCSPTSTHPPFQPHPALTYPLEWPLLFEAQPHINSLLPDLQMTSEWSNRVWYVPTHCPVVFNISIYNLGVNTKPVLRNKLMEQHWKEKYIIINWWRQNSLSHTCILK